jgi:glutamate synthase (NADPH/NADH) large chain
MTGGRVVVLGKTGRNFGAGMSGGIAYVHDADGDFYTRLNREMVDLDTLDEDDREWLRETIAVHFEETGSALAERLLADWHSGVERFVKVMPQDYKRVLDAARTAEERGLTVEEAIMAASRV